MIITRFNFTLRWSAWRGF